jgi:hypothetical protein
MPPTQMHPMQTAPSSGQSSSTPHSSAGVHAEMPVLVLPDPLSLPLDDALLLESSLDDDPPSLVDPVDPSSLELELDPEVDPLVVSVVVLLDVGDDDDDPVVPVDASVSVSPIGITVAPQPADNTIQVDIRAHIFTPQRYTIRGSSSATLRQKSCPRPWVATVGTPSSSTMAARGRDRGALMPAGRPDATLRVAPSIREESTAVTQPAVVFADPSGDPPLECRRREPVRTHGRHCDRPHARPHRAVGLPARAVRLIHATAAAARRPISLVSPTNTAKEEQMAAISDRSPCLPAFSGRCGRTRRRAPSLRNARAPAGAALPLARWRRCALRRIVDLLARWRGRRFGVLSRGDLEVLGISLPASREPLEIEAWAKQSSVRLDEPSMLARVTRITRAAAFLLGLAKRAHGGQVAAWSRLDSTVDHPVALALLRQTAMWGPDEPNGEARRLAEAEQLAREARTSAASPTIGVCAKLEIAARLTAALSLLEREALADALPPPWIEREVARLATDAALGGPGLDQERALHAVRPLLADRWPAPLVPRVETLLAEALEQLARAARHDPALSWISRPATEPVPAWWITSWDRPRVLPR